jgi:hypothetical protein
MMELDNDAPMLRPTILICVALPALLFPLPAAAIRCGDLLIREGDTAFEVRATLRRENCGAVLYARTVAYEEREAWKKSDPDDGDRGFHRRTVRPVEHWVIRVRNIGGVFYCHDLRFKGGVLVDIDTGRNCDE